MENFMDRQQIQESMLEICKICIHLSIFLELYVPSKNKYQLYFVV